MIIGRLFKGYQIRSVRERHIINFPDIVAILINDIEKFESSDKPRIEMWILIWL